MKKEHVKSSICKSTQATVEKSAILDMKFNVVSFHSLNRPLNVDRLIFKQIYVCLSVLLPPIQQNKENKVKANKAIIHRNDCTLTSKKNKKSRFLSMSYFTHTQANATNQYGIAIIVIVMVWINDLRSNEIVEIEKKKRKQLYLNTN